jgi:hypothetical protein
MRIAEIPEPPIQESNGGFSMTRSNSRKELRLAAIATVTIHNQSTGLTIAQEYPKERSP